MAETPNNGNGDFELPEAFSVADLETSAQQLLREDFEHLTEVNAVVLAEFEPQGGITTEERILVWSSHPEVQNDEPVLTRQHHTTMLQKLGLEFAMLEPDDPRLLFQQKYDSGKTVQIKRILRADGTSVAVRTDVDADGMMSDMLLLNDETATEDAARQKLEVETNRTINGLVNHLQIEEAEVDDFKAELRKSDLGELKAALASLQTRNAQTGDEAFDEQVNGSDGSFSKQIKVTDNAIRKARKRYAKAAMPASGYLDDFMKGRVARRAMEYGELVETNLHALEYNKDHVEQELAKEQALRHAELNKRLRRRKIISAVGVTTLTGIVDAIAVGAPTGVGYMGELHLNPTSGAVVGTVAALAITVRQFFASRRQLRSASIFTQESTTDPQAPLPEQLSAEIERGDQNANIVRNVGS
jgi:hypothetical protein